MTIVQSRSLGLCPTLPVHIRSTMLVLGLFVGGALATPVDAQVSRLPLLAEGKETVYQRVLTRPKARLHTDPDTDAIGTYPAFQPLYVFDRRDDWIRVGPSISGKPEGWVTSDSVIDWKQNIIAAFTNSAGRQRQLLMETDTQLRSLMENEELAAVQADILAEAEKGAVPAERGIVAVEPTEYVNITEQLYLMPILDFSQELHPRTYEENLLMKVASVPLRDQKTPAPKDEDFDVGIVFVIDTTQSMGPYIASTQAAVQTIVNDLSGTEIGKNVQFGFVAFRDSIDAAPGLDYLARTFVDLDQGRDAASFLSRVNALQAARISSQDFVEDAYTGVEQAIETVGWSEYAARYIVLVTDAGARDADDPLSGTGMEDLQ